RETLSKSPFHEFQTHRRQAQRTRPRLGALEPFTTEGETMMTKLSGGGSNKYVSPNIKTGSPYKATSAAAADQLGQATSFKKEQVDRGRAYTGAPLGNEVALNVGAGGPGAGRTTMRSGSQNFYGSPNRGEAGMQPSTADRGARAILGEKGSKT